SSIRGGAIVHGGWNTNRAVACCGTREAVDAGHQVHVVVAAVNVAVGADALRDRAEISRELHFGEGTLAQKKTMDVGRATRCVLKRSDNVSARADPARVGRDSAGIIDGSKVPGAEQETMLLSCRVRIDAHDLPAGVDALGVGEHSAGEIDGSELKRRACATDRRQ